MLLALARLRIARTGDLARLCFPGVRRDTVNDRLRALFDGGYLDVSMPERAAENLYSLGPRGRDLVRGCGEVAASVPRGGLAHHLAIVRTWVEIVTAELPATTVELARPDWELRAEFGDLPSAIVPDLFVVLATPRGQVALAVEVDLATEPLHVLRDKFHAYGELAASGSGLFGWREFAVALALIDDQRRAAVAHLSAAGWGGSSPIWTLTEGPRASLRSLVERPLTSSPYGKGGGRGVSDDGRRDARACPRGLSEE